jgi:hypothetical protein
MSTYISPNGNPEVWEEKPSGYFTQEEWDTAHPAPAPEPPTLAEAKARKLEEINLLKWGKIEGGEVEYENLHFHTDSASQSLLGNAILMHQALNTLPQVWKAKDGYLPITSIDQLTAIGALVAAYVEGLFGTEYVLRQQAEAAETADEIAAVIWPE